MAVFDALPDGESRHAILRTLRSGVDWRSQAITMLDRAYLAEGDAGHFPHYAEVSTWPGVLLDTPVSSAN
ncbi:MAG TPA: hypothetical protein VMU09_04760 [Acidimicrobiales bacterium]|nr:hypothetical protein [Acidimicrobiales bacterium]